MFLSVSKPMSLRERLGHFLKENPGAEPIDEIGSTTLEQRNCKRADFFFQERTIIGELKNLETDASSKIEKLIRIAQVKHQVPLYWMGVVPLSSLLKNFPNKEELNQQILVSITAPIRGAFGSANRQIRQTKRAYNLRASGGLLVLGNESVPNLSPAAIAWSINWMFTKRTEGGELRYPEINAVWIIIENYVVELEGGATAIPSFTMRQDLVVDPAKVGAFADLLQLRWAQLHSAKVVKSSGGNIADMQFRKRGRSRDDRVRLRPTRISNVENLDETDSC
jgi:hypothetical protein